MACAGEAISSDVEPENIIIDVNQYSQDDKNYDNLKYHNAQDICSYIKTSMHISRNKSHNSSTGKKKLQFQ